jgi:hypothetical protein
LRTGGGGDGVVAEERGSGLQHETVVPTRRNGQQMHARFFLPERARRPVPAVVVIFDVFGMTADLNRIAGRFAEEGYGVIIPDLFDRPELRLACVVRARRLEGKRAASCRSPKASWTLVLRQTGLRTGGYKAKAATGRQTQAGRLPYILQSGDKYPNPE